MTKTDDTKMVGGCGGNCACARASEGETKEANTCLPPKDGMVPDKDGKCPCGKDAKDCCHSEKIFASELNEALDELCEPHQGKVVC